MRLFKQIFWLLLIVALAAGVAYTAHNYPGEVIINVASHRITMKIFVVVLLLLVTVAFLISAWWLYATMVGLPQRWRDWRAQKRENRSLSALQTATLALHEGRWAHADKAVKIAARHPQAAGLAALLGAASAHAQKKPNQATDWLGQLDNLDDKADFADAKALQNADMALAQGDASAALTYLDGVSAQLRKHSERYQTLLVSAHAAAKHWHEVLQISLDKKWKVPLTTKSHWQSQAIIGLSNDATSSASYLTALHKDMPDDVRANDEVIMVYTKALIRTEALSHARRVVEEAQRDVWRPQLLKFYVQASDADSLTSQLKMLDAWEKQRQAANKPDALLQIALGQLCLKAQIWGRAKKSFADSLAIRPTAQAHQGLAQAYRAMDDIAHAQEEERLAAHFAVI
jgi:HemY protein